MCPRCGDLYVNDIAHFDWALVTAGLDPNGFDPTRARWHQAPKESNHAA